MRRLVRWLNNGLTALSLLLFLAIGLSWWLSVYLDQQIVLAYEKHKVSATTTTGQVCLTYTQFASRTVDRLQYEWALLRPRPAAARSQFLGIGWQREQPVAKIPTQWTLAIPHGYLMLVALAFPAWRWIRWRHRGRRVRFGMCAACGYDLRATPDRCPECGAVPSLPTDAETSRTQSRRISRKLRQRLITAAISIMIAIGWATWHYRVSPAISIRLHADIQDHLITFFDAPDAPAFRYVARLPGQWSIRLNASSSQQLHVGASHGVRLDNVESLTLEHGRDSRLLLQDICDPNSGFRTLRGITFTGWQWNSDEFAALARPASGLRHLTFVEIHDHNFLDTDELIELTRPGTSLASLPSLRLTSTHISARGLAVLSRPSSGLKGLRSLTLDSAEIDNSGLIDLARSTALKNLQRFSIGNGQFTDAGLLKLANPECFPALIELQIGSRYTDGALEDLRRARPSLRVTVLHWRVR